MKKRINIIFFGICFLAALIGEAYCFVVLEGDLFSTVSIGIVVLITGYIFMDSLRSKLVQTGENAKFYLDHILRDETERWNERYTELVNMQKATYTATKKQSAMLEQQLKEVLLKQESIETGIIKELQRMIELQKKALEGQKNALNLEINYNKENTKQLMQVLREESMKNEWKDQFSKILDLLESNQEIMRGLKYSVNTENPIIDKFNSFATEEKDSYDTEFPMSEYKDDPMAEEQNDYDNTMVTEDIEEKTSDLTWPLQEESEAEVESDNMESKEEVEDLKVVPLYEDPHKNLTADEIAALFASVNK